MPEIVFEEKAVIPASVRDHETFCRWALSGKFPDRGRFAFLNDGFWVDLETETEDHNYVKNIIAVVLTTIIIAKKLGRFYADRMMFSNRRVRISTEPDGMFVATETRRSKRVRVRAGKAEGGKAVILEGSPDMVLEVISDSSVRKDTVKLLDLYWRAGVKEYWLVDARGAEPSFTIYTHAATSYRAGRSVEGWRKSGVFGASFRLVRTFDDLGLPEYSLEVR